MGTYTTERLQTDGLEPTLRMLLNGASQGRRLPYKKVAEYLERNLGIPKIFPTHIGGVAGALVERMWEIDGDAPPINVLVVNGDDWEPGSGSNSFLMQWFGLSASQLRLRRKDYVQEAVNDVRAFRRWPEVYRKLFGHDYVLDPSITPPNDFEPDGQLDNPGFPGGGKESDEHRDLKAFVRDNPSCVGIRTAVDSARTEVHLLSGDKMDVEFLVGPMRIGVEVKSIRSGDADLERGIYQCVKYHAVMVAESGFSEIEADCHAILVTERPLPMALQSLARRLGVRHKVVALNV